jgi:hypothetical protein
MKSKNVEHQKKSERLELDAEKRPIPYPRRTYCAQGNKYHARQNETAYWVRESCSYPLFAVPPYIAAQPLEDWKRYDGRDEKINDKPEVLPIHPTFNEHRA